MVTIRIQEEGWTPLSITKSGWSVKTRPIYSYMRWTGAESVGKNAAESFTVALTLTLGGYESAIAPKNDYWWF